MVLSWISIIQVSQILLYKWFGIGKKPKTNKIEISKPIKFWFREVEDIDKDLTSV